MLNSIGRTWVLILFVTILKLEHFCSLHNAPVVSEHEHLTVDTGGNMRGYTLHAVIVKWLNASERSQFVVRMNRSTREVMSF